MLKIRLSVNVDAEALRYHQEYSISVPDPSQTGASRADATPCLSGTFIAGSA
ncbi:MAG: hypothetical protein H7066_12850 [Cytophagaceae bacterium]|nr:hypothetical protein [Gemmatimonadaceae bacterium]